MTNENLFIQYDCECFNYAHNLVDLYFDYWLSKTVITNDETGFLSNVFDMLNFKVMDNGIVPVVLNYGSGITITSLEQLYYDKNYQPIMATAKITQNNMTKPIKVVDFRVKKNSLYYKELLKNAGWINATDEDAVDLYEGIFFQNNFKNSPSLTNIDKIIHNIHDLDKANDRNHEIINVFYQGISDKKYDKDQLTNFGATVSSDKYGAVITSLNGTNNILNIEKSFVTQSLSRWSGISDELNFWLDRFFDFAGIAKEKLSNQRENENETFSRVARITTLESQHFKYRKKFIDDYNEYSKTNIQISLNSLVANTNLESDKNINNDLEQEEENDFTKVE